MYTQTLKFAVIGVLNTAVSFLTFCLCLQTIKCHYWVALAISHLVGVLNSYVWNSKWTFGNRDMHLKQFMKFVLVYVAAYVLNFVILSLGIRLTGLNILVLQAISLLMAASFSFTGQKYWTFAGEKRFEKRTSNTHVETPKNN